jgi:hypothetical protein
MELHDVHLPPGPSVLEMGLAAGQHSEPAPEGEFAMTIRAYGPKEELINGDWSPPPVKIGKG